MPSKDFHIKRKSLHSYKKSSLFLRIIATTVISLVVIFAVVKAGSLTPSALPGASGFGLVDIYNRLMGDAAVTAGSHAFSPAGGPGASMYSLKQIYEAIPAIDPATLLTNAVYLGVEGIFDISHLSDDVIKKGVTWGANLSSTGTLTPDGGTATAADLFSGKTANLTNDWDLDAGTLSLACNTSSFNALSNRVPNAYDGAGNGSNRWCMTDSGDAAAGDIRSGKVAWIDGAPITGSANVYVYGSDTAVDVLTTATSPGTYNVSNLLSSVIQQGITWGASLGSTGTLTPDGGTAAAADVFSGKTAHLSGDWSLDTGTLDLACNTATFNGTLNLVGNTYDGAGSGTNRWCMTDSGDAAAGDIRSGRLAWIDGVAVMGAANIYVYGSNTASDVLSTATAAGTYDATNLNVGAVKSGTAFGVGLTGDYPSATYPLPSASGTTDLAGDGSNITSSNGAAEWWTSSGSRQSATLDFPGLSNLCSTDTSNNSAGTLTVSAAAIRVGDTYCGIAGTLLANEFNGTTGIYTGGSQANGGGDDYNNGGAAPGDRYSKSWTACTAGNSYCGTSDSGADAKDDSTGLIWSLPCNGSGCASFSDATPLTYTWDNSGPNNNSLTASQLCSGHAGWFLPHQKQTMQAYIDGSYGNLEAVAVNRPYWTATTQASTPTGAWATYLSIGGTGTTAKTINGGYVRCVR